MSYGASKWQRCFILANMYCSSNTRRLQGFVWINRYPLILMATQEYPSASFLWGYLLNKSICPCKTLASIDHTADWLGEVCHNVEKEPSLLCHLQENSLSHWVLTLTMMQEETSKQEDPNTTIHPVFIHSTTNMMKRTGRSWTCIHLLHYLCLQHEAWVRKTHVPCCTNSWLTC